MLLKSDRSRNTSSHTNLSPNLCPVVCLHAFLSDHSHCVEAGGGERGGEGARLSDSSAAQESSTDLQTGPQHLQDARYTHSVSLNARQLSDARV